MESNPVDFLRLLYGDKFPGYLEVRTILGRRVLREFITTAYDLERVLPRRLRLYADCYYTVCTHTIPDGKKATVNYAPGLWIDIDQESPAISGITPPPSLVVSSGRGYHVYWLFTSPLPLTPETSDTIESCLKVLARRYDADKAATDISRILRLPGTVNQKNRKPCRILTVNTLRYNSGIIRNLLE